MSEITIEEKNVELSADLATVTTEVLKDVNESTAFKMIDESKLNEEQKKIASQIYESVKLAITDFISNTNINNTIKVTRTIAQIIKQIENVKLDGKSIPGIDKKLVTLELGRILIKEVTPDDKGESEIIMIYDMIAETTLEAMIEVSKVVNVIVQQVVQEVALNCCPSLFSLIKRHK